MENNNQRASASFVKTILNKYAVCALLLLTKKATVFGGAHGGARERHCNKRSLIRDSEGKAAKILKVRLLVKSGSIDCLAYQVYFVAESAEHRVVKTSERASDGG